METQKTNELICLGYLAARNQHLFFLSFFCIDLSLDSYKCGWLRQERVSDYYLMDQLKKKRLLAFLFLIIFLVLKLSFQHSYFNSTTYKNAPHLNHRKEGFPALALKETAFGFMHDRHNVAEHFGNMWLELKYECQNDSFRTKKIIRKRKANNLFFLS